jgi:phytoene dehydrogenase-like protein
MPEHLEFSSELAEQRYDAVVVGAGPNGLAAAITVARAGRSVLVVEAAETIGGGTRSAELTLPGFVHDVCSAIHALGVASPFFKSLPLDEFGLEWIHPDAPLAHALDNGDAAVAERSLEATCEKLGRDGDAYRKLFTPLVDGAEKLLAQNFGPLRPPRNPWLMAQFGWRAVRSACGLARSRFRDDRAQGLFMGMAAHSVLPLEDHLTAAVGLMLGITAHGDGWPVAKGGSQQIANAMARYLKTLGGEIVVKRRVTAMGELPTAEAYLFDVTPRQLSSIAGESLPVGFRRKLQRFRHGPGVFKLDWALDGPIPWKSPECARAGTVHVGGTLDEIAAAERAPWDGRCADRPFLLVAQQSLFDPTRAPAGKQTGWGYCHVPNGSTEDMTERIEAQMERFAPGFGDLILARHVTTPADFEQGNANYIGGDITGGVMDLRQLFARPTARWNPYTTPARHIFLCSASTPPGGGVHGMCGYHAAQAALSGVLRRKK